MGTGYNAGEEAKALEIPITEKPDGCVEIESGTHALARLVNSSSAWKAWINRLMVLLEDEAAG